MSLKCIDFLYVIKYTIVNDCFVICVGSSLLSKTVDVTLINDYFCILQILIDHLNFLESFLNFNFSLVKLHS